MADSYWLTSTFWYCSLVLSILGILLSAQQIAVLDLLGEPRSHGSRDTIANEAGRYLPLMLMEVKQSRRADSDIGVWKPRWKMVFIWQCPIMFLSYSVCLFLLGLTILVCTPLIRGGGWSTDYNVREATFNLCNLIVQASTDLGKVAIIYLAITAAASGTFVFCSFWVYYYVNPDYEFEHLSETDGKSPAQLPISSTEQATYTTHYKRDQEDMTDSIRASPYYDNRSS